MKMRLLTDCSIGRCRCRYRYVDHSARCGLDFYKDVWLRGRRKGEGRGRDRRLLSEA